MSQLSRSELETVATAVNRLASFLALEQIRSAEDLLAFLDSLPAENIHQVSQSTDVIVLCGNAILSIAETVFSAVAHGPICHRRLILLICGGVGHSTPFLYEAVEKHPKYKVIADEIKGKPESHVLQLIAERWFGLKVRSVDPEVGKAAQEKLAMVVEDQSTNCGANATETRKILEGHGIRTPRSIVVVQDPTMSRRTVASFEKTYGDFGSNAPKMVGWPTFTPRVSVKETENLGGDGETLSLLEYMNAQGGLWSMRRFVGLIMGEIPRLRDDASGYGPEGKWFIAHVDIPADVEKAWRTLDSILQDEGRRRNYEN